MKKTIYLIAAVILAVFCTSCTLMEEDSLGENVKTEASEKPLDEDSNKNDESLQDTKENANTEETENPYQDVIDRYYNYIFHRFDTFGTGEGLAAEAYWYDENGESIGYTVKDINGDGFDELLIGAVERNPIYGDNEIYAAYTLVDNNPSFLFEGWARSRYYLTENGEFYHEGSSGAAYSYTAIYYVSDNGTLGCRAAYFTEPSEDWSSTIYYYSSDGNWDSSQAMEFDPEMLDELYPEFKESKASCCFVEFTPFSQHTVSEKNKLLAPSVSGKWLNDVSEDITINYTYNPENSDPYQKIVYFADEDITNFKILSVEHDYDENYDYIYTTKELYTVSTLYKGQSVLCGLITFEYIPQNAISYVDKSGRTRRFLISQSGEDGSVIMEEF